MNRLDQNKKVVVFDFDGTLVDSMDEFADIASKVISDYYQLDLAEARRRYIETSGVPFYQQLDIIYPGHALNAEASQAYESQKAWTYLKKRAFPDVEKGMATLKEMGYQTVISSNNFQELVDQLVERIGIPLDLVLGFRPNFEKGADHFRYIRSHFSCHNSDILFVGDSLHDFKRAKAEEIDFVARVGTFTHGDFLAIGGDLLIIETLHDLTAHLSDQRTPLTPHPESTGMGRGR